jgi:N-acetylglucosamine kinase-like BadF-type ATPase
MYVIGIDGGGTKTTAWLVHEHGEVCATATVGASNLNGETRQVVQERLAALCHLLKEQAPDAFQQVRSVYGGFAGGDHPAAKTVLQTWLAAHVVPQAEITIEHDAITALYSGTRGAAGVVHIAGTGSIAFGLNKAGRRKRVGGWGYLVGDPGSGFAIGRAGCQAVFCAFDGSGPQTKLVQYMLEAAEARTVPDLLPFIYEQGQSRTKIASLAKIVFQAADEGDQVAIDLLERTAREAAQQIRTVIRHLFAEEDTVPVVCAGGIYQRADWLMPILEQELREQPFTIDWIRPTRPPVAGAIYGAFRSQKLPLPDLQADHRIREGGKE